MALVSKVLATYPVLHPSATMKSPKITGIGGIYEGLGNNGTDGVKGKVHQAGVKAWTASF